MPQRPRGLCWVHARGASPTRISLCRERGERGAHWGGTAGTSEGLGGVQGEEMECLWRNQMEQGSLFLSCFSFNLGRSLAAIPHDTKFDICGVC